MDDKVNSYVLVYDQEQWTTAIRFPKSTTCVVPTKIFYTDERKEPNSVCGFELRSVCPAKIISFELLFYLLDELVGGEACELLPDDAALREWTPEFDFLNAIAGNVEWFQEATWEVEGRFYKVGVRLFTKAQSFVEEYVRCPYYTRNGFVQTMVQNESLSAALLQFAGQT